MILLDIKVVLRIADKIENTKEVHIRCSTPLLLQYSSSCTNHHILQYFIHLLIQAAIFHPAREIVNILTIANSKNLLIVIH